MYDKISVTVKTLYKRISWPLEQVLFPLVLLLWPLVKVCVGADVSDSTYSLGNYMYPDKLQGMWLVSTYLSNGIGSILVRLPGGNTLVGANIYMGLVVSAIALICYYALKKDFSAPILFAGEYAAIAFCWIPTGILYNYMSYLMFTLGAVLLYMAIRDERDYLYALAGIVLGLNVFVRIPNVTQALLIVTVWATAVWKIRYTSKDTKVGAVALRSTGYCILGYVVGVLVPFCLVVARFGIDGFADRITEMFAISGTDDTYTTFSMITSVVSAYVRSFKWIAIIAAVIFMGTLMFAAFNKEGILKWIKRGVYILVVGVMLRFFWGRGMFTFKYYEDYTAMFEWGMIILLLAWICAITVLARRDYNILVKTLATIVLVVLIVTPLGSNNFTCQNLNNMFLVMPFVLYVTGGWLHRGAHKMRMNGLLYGCNFPWMSMLLIVFTVTYIQITGFHTQFVFRDGMDGTLRDVKVSGVPSLEGIYTTADNAASIEGLYAAIPADVTSAVFWGDCPGLSYILRMSPAISSTWPDLDSYPTATFEEQLMQLRGDCDNSVIIIRKLPEPSGINGAVKQDILQDYIVCNHMSQIFENDEYIVYR